MSESLMGVWINPDQAGAHLNRVVVPWCKQRMSEGKRIRVRFNVEEDFRTLQQNAFYWSFVLKQVSQQATLNGIGADEEGWHYYFKKTVLGYRIVKVRVPGSKRPAIRRELWSTKDLTIKKMATYLEQVMAKAATEFGVTFDNRRWEDWQL